MTDHRDAVCCGDLEAIAERRLAPGPFGYFAGGAGDERTLRANAAAWHRYALKPRVLVDVADVDASTTVLGTEIASPVLVAPTALQRMADPEGEPAMARAAAAAGTIFTLSTLASSRPAEVAAKAPEAPRWFQLYVMKDRAISRALCDEALEHGFTAVVLTVDAPRAGRRERDLRTGFTVPPEIDMPAVTAAMGPGATPTPAEFFGLVETALTWADLERLAHDLPVPVVVKGVQAGEDARLAAEHGAQAVIVSNHGGRQLDGARATADVLPEVVEAAGDRVEVLVDGGIRRGADVLVALALGARAALVGRPPLFGLAAGGEAGALHALRLLQAEVELGLGLLGTPTPADVGPEHVVATA